MQYLCGAMPFYYELTCRMGSSGEETNGRERTGEQTNGREGTKQESVW
ncbi:MAG: hypothetical protein IJ621_03560 [Paludibacteraceae bacterium]|nr:hypothetical protein [Paludibacteraceae bacterium]